MLACKNVDFGDYFKGMFILACGGDFQVVFYTDVVPTVQLTVSSEEQYRMAINLNAWLFPLYKCVTAFRVQRLNDRDYSFELVLNGAKRGVHYVVGNLDYKNDFIVVGRQNETFTLPKTFLLGLVY